MRFAFSVSLIFLIYLLTFPAKETFAQLPQQQSRPSFGQILSTTSVAEKEAFMKALLNRRMIAKNPTGFTHSSKILAGSLAITVFTTGTTCGASNGSFLVTASGGTAPYQYSENGYPPQSDGLFPEKAPGVYNITVTDAGGQTATTTITLTNTYPQPDVPFVYTYVNATGCSGADGSVTINASGGTPPYEFSIDDIHFQTSNVFTNLVPGDYSFFVRDANGCENVKYFPLYRSCSISFGYGYSGSICHPGDGYIDIVNVSGGTPPYTYSDDGINYQSSPNFSGYSFGRHFIWIKDAAGLIETYSFPIYQFCPIDVAAIATPPTCGQHDGAITAQGSNGQQPYRYSIDGTNFQSNAVFTGLAPGNYTVTVKDVNDLTAITTVVVPDGCPHVTVATANDICARSIGSVTATGTGGTLPYTFSIDGINFQTGNSFSGLAAGNYTLTIRDKNNFTATAGFSISSSCPLVNAVVTNSTCGNANGSITATGTNGTSPYQYSIDGVNFQSSGLFINLPAATYTVYVRDAIGGQNQTTAVLGNDAGPTLQITPSAASCNDNDGSLTISATGGSPPLQYSIDGNVYQTAPVFSALKSGNYIVTIKDANGCPASQPVTISLINTVTVDAGADLPVCEGKTIQLNGQSNGASLSWTPADHLQNPATLRPTASPTQTTKYYLTARTGVCTRVDSMIVQVEPAPVAATGGDTAICLGKSIQIHGSGGIAYSWTPARYLDNTQLSDPTVISPAATTIYHLVVTDGNGCQSLNDARVKVTVTPQAKVSAGRDTSIAIEEPLQLHAIDVNNSDFNSYVWRPAVGLDNAYSQDPIAVLDESMTYTLTATAPGGCMATTQIHISVYKGPDIYVPGAFSPNGDGHNDLLRAIPIGIKTFRYFRVFSRWGELLFQTTNPSAGWDGWFKGNPQPTATFVWMAEGVDYQGRTIQRKGSVILIR